MKTQLFADDMFVYREYFYDRHADSKKTIYVGITNFLAYNLPVVQYVEFQKRVYKRVCSSAIPAEDAGHVACVQQYEYICESGIDPLVIG